MAKAATGTSKKRGTAGGAKSAPKSERSTAKKSADKPRRAKLKESAGKGMDKLRELIDNPIVADLLAVGAMAAVAAIADQAGKGRAGAEAPSKKAMKAAAKAAASAIGTKLLAEYGPKNSGGSGRSKKANAAKA